MDNKSSKLTLHYLRVLEFSQKGHQHVASKPTIPDPVLAIYRSRLILEEALELIKGLGVTVFTEGFSEEVCMNDLKFHADTQPNLKEILDGACDLRVVTTGTLIACGLPDKEPQQIVDCNNLTKFSGWTEEELAELKLQPVIVHKWNDGTHTVLNLHGKVMKPASYVKPDLTEYAT